MKNDRLIVSYSKMDHQSTLLIGRENIDGTTTIINEAINIEADTIYGIIMGFLKMNNNVGYYFSLNANKEINNEKQD